MHRKPNHIEALTSLRFLSALWVVFFHHGQPQFAGAPDWLLNIVKSGYVGVPFFFVLSGFILAYNYAPRSGAAPLDSRRFWAARFARIYPVYLVALLVSAPLFAAALAENELGPSFWSRLLLQTAACLVLVQSWVPGWAWTWNGPAWSLSVEAAFYASFPLLMNKLKERGRWRLWLGFCMSGGLMLGLVRLSPPGSLVSAAHELLDWSHPLLWWPLFLLGVCTGERHLRQRGRAGNDPKPRQTAGAALALTALILGVMATGLHRHSQLLLCYTVAVPCALLLDLLARDQSSLGRLLSLPWLVVLGEASYSLYILHRPIHDWFSWATTMAGLPAISSSSGFALYLALCLVLSVLSLRLIEYPCRKWIRQRLTSARPRHDHGRGLADAPGLLMSSRAEGPMPEKSVL